MRPSIRRRLVLLILCSILMAWGFALISSYQQAKHEVETWEQARLAELAQMLAVLDPSALQTLATTRIDLREEERGGEPGANDADDDDALPRDALFQVRDANNRILAGSAQLSAPTAPDWPAPSISGAQNVRFNGQLWRSYLLRRAAHGRSVRVLELANTRSDLVSGVGRRIAQPILLALPVLALLVWFSIALSLAPLRTLSRAVLARNIDRLEAIEIDRAPTEVRPLVDAINHVLARFQRSLQRERAFTADAAHELKTPLAAIKVQAQVALVERDPLLQRLAMERVVQGVDRTSRLAQQLLLLARLDEQEALSTVSLNPATIAKDAVLANQHNAYQKNISLALAGEPHTEIAAEPVLVGIMLDNLIDNSIKYGRVGGRIEVRVRRQSGSVTLVVSDDGPGVAKDDEPRLTNRFFRAAGAQASGSGLGLSIVARIAEHFNARLAFGVGIGDRGLAVEIHFPDRYHAA